MAVRYEYYHRLESAPPFENLDRGLRAEIYDPATSTFTPVYGVPDPMDHSAALLPSGKILVLGPLHSTVIDPKNGEATPTAVDIGNYGPPTFTMLDEHTDIDPLVAMRAVSSPGEIQALTTALGGVYVSTAVKQYVVNLVSATRATPQIQLGASPRAALQLLRTARAIAALHGRDFVLPDDVRSLATPVLAHRLLLDADVRAAGQSAADVLSRLIALTPVPDGRNRK